MTKYRTIVVDPPWAYDEGWPSLSTSQKRRPGYQTPAGADFRRRTVLPYASMTVASIKALPIQDIADSGCHVYLWTTNRYLRSAFDVLDAWDVRFGQLLTWAKTPMGIGPGGDFAQSTEFILTGRIGSLRCLQRQNSTWFNWPRAGNAHSRKPPAFLDMVEQVSPSPRLEMFARRQRLGWDTWGDQALEHVDLVARDA
jgi:N6-adenosine-specific RNA methylase IME4